MRKLRNSLLTLLLTVVPCGATAFSSWVIYWDKGKSLEAYERYGSALEEVSLFTYRFDPGGKLVPARPEVVRAALELKKEKKSRLAVSVCNDRDSASGPLLKDPAIVHDILADPARFSAHVLELATLAEGFDALEMDYENLLLKDRDGYSRLIAALAETLHSRGKQLSVVVQAKTREVAKDGPGAMDWKALGAGADLLKIMAYNYHTSRGRPGPISPPAWISDIARYAKSQVSAEKLSIILPLHGFDWTEGGAGKDVLFEKAQALAAAHGAAPQRDAASREMVLRYEQGAEKHEVWYQDAGSLKAKAAAVEAAGIGRVGLWKLGTGEPAFWDDLRSGR